MIPTGERLIQEIVLIEIRDKQIEETVLVKVCPGTGDRAAAGLVNIAGKKAGKAVIAVVSKQEVVTTVSHYQVEVTIVVEITPTAAERIRSFSK